MAKIKKTTLVKIKQDRGFFSPRKTSKSRQGSSAGSFFFLEAQGTVSIQPFHLEDKEDPRKITGRRPNGKDQSEKVEARKIKGERPLQRSCRSENEKLDPERPQQEDKQ